MSKIRINELARQLEVKSREVIDKLHELGIAEKVTHSSSIDEDKAETLRRYYRGEDISAAVSSSRNGSATAIEEAETVEPREEREERRPSRAATRPIPPPAEAPAPVELKAEPAPAPPQAETEAEDEN